MSFSSFVWNRIHKGMLTLKLGDYPHGYFVGGAFGTSAKLELRGQIEIALPWTGGKDGAPFTTATHDIWVTAKDGYSYVGMVADDGHHSLVPFDLREGRNAQTGEPYLCAQAPVPHRALALWCDASGDAVFADGFRISGALRGTRWQQDAVNSQDGRTVTPGFFRMRPTGAEQVEDLNVERVKNVVGQAGDKVFCNAGCLVGATGIIATTFALTACSFMSEYGSSGVDAWMMLVGSLLVLSVVLGLWGILTKRVVLTQLARGPRLGKRSKKELDGHLQAKGNAQKLAALGLVATLVAGAWIASDYSAEPERHTGIYHGPSYTELLDEKNARNNDRGGNHDPAVTFTLESGEVVKAKSTPDEFWEDLGEQAQDGDRYEVLVYPHTRIVRQVKRIG